MASYKKKIVLFLVAAALGGVALMVRPARSTAVGASKPLSGNSSGDSKAQKSVSWERSSLFANDPNFSVRPSDSLNSRELFFKMMLSILLVVVLGVAAIYISKKFGAKISNLPGKKIRIIETVHLGPRKTVHLIKIGNRRLLIGSTNENITRLADVTDALADLSATEVE